MKRKAFRFSMKIALWISIAAIFLSASSPFQPLAAAPSNDLFANALVIPPADVAAGGYTSTGISTVDATSNEPQDLPLNICDNALMNAGIHSVWYKYTPVLTQSILMDTFGSTPVSGLNYDTMIGLFVGVPGGISLLACNDDAGVEGSTNSHLAWRLEAGKTYYIKIASYGADPGGNLVFHFKRGGIEVEISGVFKEVYALSSGKSVTPGYDGVQGGPVRVINVGGGFNIFTSERSVFNGTSFNETMGYPADRLTTEYWFPWYDKKTMITRVLIGNPNATETAKVELYIEGVKKDTFDIPPYGSVTPGYDGVVGGPVRVLSIPNGNGVTVPIFTSERSVFAGVSFNETMGYPANRLATEYWFPWYDKKTMITRVLIGNPNQTETAKVELYIAGVKKDTFDILPNKNVTPGYDGLVGGPVRVLSIPNANNITVPVFTSERSVFAGTSFEEVMGYPADQLTTEYWFTWYDKKSMVTRVLIGNPNPTEDAKVELYIAGVKKETFVIPPNGSVTPGYDGVQGGPVRVLSIPNANSVTVPVFTSERSVFARVSFNETMGYPANQLTTEYWFPWYDKKSMITRVLIGRP